MQGASIKSYYNITQGSDLALENASINGTVSVAIDGQCAVVLTRIDWHLCRIEQRRATSSSSMVGLCLPQLSDDVVNKSGGGIYEKVGCSRTDLDHGVSRTQCAFVDCSSARCSARFAVIGYDYVTYSKTDVVAYWQVKNRSVTTLATCFR